MHVLTARVELHLTESRSLKEKRRIRQSLLSRWWGMHLAAAEVGEQDSHSRLVLGLAAVGAEVGHLTELVAAAERICYALDGVEVVQFAKEYR